MPTRDETTIYKELIESSKKESNTDSINPSLPFLQVSRKESDYGEEAKRKEMSAEEIENYREVIRYNIDYDILVDDHPEDKSRLDEVVELLTETVYSTKKYVRIGVLVILLLASLLSMNCSISGLSINDMNMKNMVQKWLVLV